MPMVSAQLSAAGLVNALDGRRRIRVNCRADAGATDDQQHRDCEHYGCAQDQSAPRPIGLRTLRPDWAYQAAHRGEPREQGLTQRGGTPLRSERSEPLGRVRWRRCPPVSRIGSSRAAELGLWLDGS